MKFATVVATTGLLASTVLVGASPAQATDTCNGDEGKMKKKVGSASYHWIIRQHDIDENYSGKPKKLRGCPNRGLIVCGVSARNEARAA